jgi:AcrR family transcriptional regulator
MKSAAVRPRPYRQTRRADAALSTRNRILDAARAVLSRAAGDLSLEDVAEHARVGRPTIYRHFGSRAMLFRAVVEEMSKTHGIDATVRRALTIDDPASSVRLFVDLSTAVWARDLQLIRGALHLQADPEIGEVIRELDLSRARDASAIAELASGRLPANDLARTLILLTSPSTFVQVVDHLGLTPEQARRYLARIARALA